MGRQIIRKFTIMVVVSFVVVIGVGTARAQETGAPEVSSCKVVAPTHIASLDAIKAAIKAYDLPSLRKKLEAHPESAEARKLRRELDAIEEQLADILYGLECNFAYIQDATADADKIVEVTGWYATNRERTGYGEPDGFYGSKDAKSLQYGRFTINIPARHKLSNIKLPWLWKIVVNPDPASHFVIKVLSPLSGDAALAELREASIRVKEKSLLLFVHGFNTSFADAARRTAQLSADLKFQGVPMFMSWPATKNYAHDIESVEAATPVFSTLLNDIAGLHFEEVYILAHSMGNRLVTRVLAERQKSGSDIGRITELLLAAPDINAHIFKEQIAPVLGRLTNVRKTIYASSNDVALKVSMMLHGFPRVGETVSGVHVYEGFDTIDSSKAAPLARGFGHSYVFDSMRVIADLEELLINRKPPSKRGLKRVGVGNDQYWLIE